MIMKITLGEIRLVEPALKMFNQREMPIGLSYKLAKLYKKFFEECQAVEAERIKLIKSLSSGEEDEQGNFVVLPEKTAEFREKFEELLKTETTIEFETISIEELGDINIKPDDLVRLDKIISFDK
jgi:hypothetical protein